MNKQTREIMDEIVAEIKARPAKEVFRLGIRRNKFFLNVFTKDLQEKLYVDLQNLLIYSGYQPENDSQFFDIIEQEFDFNTQLGIAMSVNAEIDPNVPFPILLTHKIIRGLDRIRDEAKREGEIEGRKNAIKVIFSYLKIILIVLFVTTFIVMGIRGLSPL